MGDSGLIRLVVEPETDKLAQDVDDVVHYTRMMQLVVEYKDGARYGRPSSARIVYCNNETVDREIDRTPDAVITCVRCRGIYG
jgi:hypothetical protein